MSVGPILLIVVTLLVLFGVSQRVLDKLRLTDRQALLFAALLLVGGLLPDLPITPLFSVNVGGALVPLGLSVYLLAKAGSGREVGRALAASVVTGAAIHLLGEVLPAEPEALPIDPLYLYGLAGGVVAYVFGRSRRGAFVAGVLGSMLSNVWDAVQVWRRGVAQPLSLGGAGALDMIVLTALTAVLIAELAGEVTERIVRARRRDKIRVFEAGDFVKGKRGEPR